MDRIPIDASEILVLTCPECSFITLKIASLDKHLKTHDCCIHVKLSKCKQCGMVTNSERVIEEHVEIWHPSKDVKENVAVVFDEKYNQEKPPSSGRKANGNQPQQQQAIGRQTGSLQNLPVINLLQLMNMAHGPVEINLPGAYNLDRTKDGVTARISYMPGFIARTVGDQFLESLKQDLSWKQLGAKSKDGTQRQEPRLTCYVGPDFEWSGNKFENCNDWNPKLLDLKGLVEQAVGRSFNAVICYMYRHGRDSLGWHCENEKQLGEHPYIAAVTLGQARYEEFMRKGREDRYVRVRATHGDLVITEGAIEELWLHRVPKDQMARRTSFTFSFRNINPKPEAAPPKEPAASKASENAADAADDDSKAVKKSPGPVGSGKAKKK